MFIQGQDQDMIRDRLQHFKNEVKSIFFKDRLLFISSLFTPLICPLFFYFPSSILRNIFYISLLFSVPLLIKKKTEIKQLIIQDKPAWITLIAFILFMCLSVFWSETIESSRYFEKGKLFVFIGLATISTFYIAYKIPGFSEAIKNLYIFGAVSSAIVLIVHHVILNGFTWPQVRLEGMGRAENPVQASLVYGLAILAIIFGKFPKECTPKFINISKILMSVPPLTVMLMTQSRGPFLSMIITIIGIYIFNSQDRIKKLLFIGICLFCVSIPAYMEMSNTEVLNRKTTGRFEIWGKATEKILSHPIVGNGLASDGRYTYTNERGANLTASHIHSLYLSTLYQGGLIGFALLISSYILFTKRFLKIISNQDQNHLWIGAWVLMGAAFGISDFGGIIINLSTEWLVFWWPMALVLAYSVTLNNNQRNL